LGGREAYNFARNRRLMLRCNPSKDLQHVRLFYLELHWFYSSIQWHIGPPGFSSMRITSFSLVEKGECLYSMLLITGVKIGRTGKLEMPLTTQLLQYSIACTFASSTEIPSCVL